MRNLGLDLLRIFAVFLVLGRHLHLPDGTNVIMRSWQRGGWIGVDLFFVLSGFLVSSLLFREHIRNGKADLTRFLIRRGFKIYPAFWVLLASSALMNSRPSGSRFLAELLFVQNYFEGVWGYTWSLAVEEHFYIGIAILFGCWAYKNPKHTFSAMPGLFLAVAIICLSFRLVNVCVYPEFSVRNHLAGTHIRIDSLFFGVLLSYYYHFHDLEKKLEWIPSWQLFGISGVLISPAFFFDVELHWWIPCFGVILFYVGSGAALLGALRFRESSRYSIKLLGILGASSYSIYLWHGPANGWANKYSTMFLGPESFYSYLAVYTIGSCILGLTMSRLIEFPALKARDRFFQSALRTKASGKEGTSL